jgi:hypothetical protein
MVAKKRRNARNKRRALARSGYIADRAAGKLKAPVKQPVLSKTERDQLERKRGESLKKLFRLKSSEAVRG